MYDQQRGKPVTENPSILIVTPAYGGMIDVHYSMSVHAEVRHLLTNDVAVSVRQVPCDSLITRGRNRLVNTFMKSRATHMMFWDGDVVPHVPGYALAMLRELQKGKFGIVGGAYPIKGPKEPRRVCCNLLKDAVIADELPIVDGFAEVRHIGTGFMMFSRNTIATLMAAHPELKYLSNSEDDHQEPLWTLFDARLRDGEYLSEDWFFCDLARDSGIKTACFVDAKFTHWGPYGFEGSFSEWFTGEAS